MKNVTKLVTLLSLTALLSPALKAKSPEAAYLETCRKDPGMPVPVVVVSPHVPAGLGGQTVPFEFIVDTSGQTSAFVAPPSADSDLVEAVVDALKQWKFKPAVSEGVPVAMKVVLPVRVIEDSRAETGVGVNW